MRDRDFVILSSKFCKNRPGIILLTSMSRTHVWDDGRDEGENSVALADHLVHLLLHGLLSGDGALAQRPALREGRYLREHPDNVQVAAHHEVADPYVVD